MSDLDCPFCSSDQIVRSTDLRTGDYDVLCTQCGATAPGEVWNTRHPEPAQAQVSDAEVEAALLSDETAVDRWRGQGIPAKAVAWRQHTPLDNWRFSTINRSADAGCVGAALRHTPTPARAEVPRSDGFGRRGRSGFTLGRDGRLIAGVVAAFQRLKS